MLMPGVNGTIFTYGEMVANRERSIYEGRGHLIYLLVLLDEGTRYLTQVGIRLGLSFSSSNKRVIL